MGEEVGTQVHEFRGFGKIPRLSRDIIVTEKIDGTNAQVYIPDDMSTILAGSRTRWITPEQDNHGFAAWVQENRDELMNLGPGRHFGEWWGGKIQRGYGIKERRFSLFNVGRWNEGNIPACCSVVPILYEGAFSMNAIDYVLKRLELDGSVAAPGFMQPEGIMVYHVAANAYFKKTILDDDTPKGLVK